MHRIHALGHPHRSRRRAGTEPLNARSDLELRAALSAVFAPLFAAAAAGFSVAAAVGAHDRRALYIALAVAFAALALVALADLLVVARRRRSGR